MHLLEWAPKGRGCTVGHAETGFRSSFSQSCLIDSVGRSPRTALICRIFTTGVLGVFCSTLGILGYFLETRARDILWHTIDSSLRDILWHSVLAPIRTFTMLMPNQESSG
jgi:hypothetical protein